MSNVTLEHGLREALFNQHTSAAAYDAAREELRRELVTAGVGDGEAAVIFETFERGPMPGFANTAAGRPAFDHALRNRVSPAAFTRFVTALKTFRGATATAGRMQETAYAVAGGAFVDKVVQEAETLRALRGDVMAVCRDMNPGISVETLYRLVGADEEARAGRFDPLRRVVAVSLDPTEFDPRQAAYGEMWGSIQGLLGAREREVLEARFGELGKEGAEAAAAAFVAWAAPAGRRKPEDETTRTLAPFRRFFDRVANASRGRGFQTVEDIWRRARRGDVAARDAGLGGAGGGVPRTPWGGGIAAPDRYVDRAGYAAMKASMERLTSAELAAAVKEQDTAIFEARKARSSAFRRARRAMFDNRVGRAARGALHALDGGFEDPFRREDQRLRALLRGRAMLSAERNARFAASSLEAGGEGRDGFDPPPPGAGPRGFAAAAEAAARSAANDDVAPRDWFVDGARGRYTVSPRYGAAASYVLSVDGGAPGGAGDTPAGAPPGGAGDTPARTPDAGGEPTPIGAFGSRDAVHAFVDAIDATRPNGGASALARRVAEQANAAPVADDANADVDVIRRSGLLDRRLDEAVGTRDMQAFAFPLTTGDVLWQDGAGRWRAGSFDEFHDDAARRRDVHLTAAAETIKEEIAARRADERMWLDVPPRDEAAAVAKGAHWDAQERRFYAPDRDTARRTAAWAPRQRREMPAAPRPAAAAYSMGRNTGAPAKSERVGEQEAAATPAAGAERAPTVGGRVDDQEARSAGGAGTTGKEREEARRAPSDTRGPTGTEKQVAAARKTITDVGDIFKSAGEGMALALSGTTGPKFAHAVRALSAVPDRELLSAWRETGARLTAVSKTIDARGRDPALARERLELTGRMMAFDAAMKSRGLRDPEDAPARAAEDRARKAAETGRER